MSVIGQPEREVQDRLIALFRGELGYTYLGDWKYRSNNSNIEDGLLSDWLRGRGHSEAEISKTLFELHREATNANRTLYGNNRAVYGLLRYGVPVKVDVGGPTVTIPLVDWKNPDKNHFSIAEEVTLRGDLERRIDLVLYINGIAVSCIELKNSRVSMSNGIRQLLSNQQKQFHEGFFATAQYLFAGSDSEGLRYGTVGTDEKHYLRWKEDVADASRSTLDKYLVKMCEKRRFLELIYDFVLFDSGHKKVPRAHQYFGVKKAQAYVARREGGIIWHTQGSGKSIVMVILARWILENYPNARVAVITDRDELDGQIERVFSDAGEEIVRASSGNDLMAHLGQARPRLLCSLIHKFGPHGGTDYDAFTKELAAQPKKVVGDLFVFVDEAHRTQSGRLHRAMKTILPNAVFFGFTGTPLLTQDQTSTLELFGQYIDRYQYREAVEDGVVLDLVYEARDVNQSLGSKKKVDDWFDAKTKGLSAWQKAELRKEWGTMQNVLSSRSRMDRIVADIVFDFSVKPRLSSERGNAILVVSSIYEACKYLELFQKTPFKGKCAIVTSYNPAARDVTLEETGTNTETGRQFIYNTYTELLKGVDAEPGKSKTATYEEWARALFVNEPASMKLLIVVDKLLTGFDAPKCTYLYIDKSMQDHGLFQAICRVNRLDSDDKLAGYIVDYKDLFPKVENAMAVYTSELMTTPEGEANILLQDRLVVGKERLDRAVETFVLLTDPAQGFVEKNEDLSYIRYFCGNTEIPSDLEEHAPRREALYKAVVSLVRAYADIADELEAAGYTPGQVVRLKRHLESAKNVREIVRHASGETLDLKAYEADMRHLIDTYIEADDPRTISHFEDISLLEVIDRLNAIAAVDDLKVKGNHEAVAETIENNVRRKIVKDNLTDPAFYAQMSALLDELILKRKQHAIEYEEYLEQLGGMVKILMSGQAAGTPKALNTPGKRALYNNLVPAGLGVADSEGHDTLEDAADTALDTALRIDEAVRRARPNDWRGVLPREQVIRRAMFEVLGDAAEVERLFQIVKAQDEY